MLVDGVIPHIFRHLLLWVPSRLPVYVITAVILALRNSALGFASDSYFSDSEGGKRLLAGDCGDLETVLPACCNFNNPPFFVSENSPPHALVTGVVVG